MKAGRVLGLVVTGAVALGVTASPVLAAPSVESGWWSATPVFAAPDVTADQLLVQGSPEANQPLAYAGISFALDAGEAPEKLVLTVAPGAAVTPGATLDLCRLLGPATSSAAPGFDCAEKIEASPAGDGGSYEFAVDALAASGSLDVAVVPTQPTDRVVLVKPTADALRSTSTGSVPGSAPTDGDVGAGSGSAVDAGGFSGGPATFDLPALPAPTAGASRDRGSGGPTAGTVELVAPAAARRSLTGDGSRSPVPLIFFGLAIAAVAFWCVAGRGSEELALDAGDNR